MKLLKSFLLTVIFIEISFCIPMDKWYKSEDLPTFFINAEQKVNNQKLVLKRNLFLKDHLKLLNNNLK